MSTTHAGSLRESPRTANATWRKPCALIAWWLVLLAGTGALHAHTLNMTRVAMTFEAGGVVTTKIDVDLGLLIGDVNGYGDLIRKSGPEQETAVRALAARVIEEIIFKVDETPLALTLGEWRLPAVPPEKIGDVTIAAMTTLIYTAKLPAGAQHVTIHSAPVAKVEFPLAYSFIVPATQTILTRWMELPGTISREFTLPAEALANAPSPTKPVLLAEGSTPKSPSLATQTPSAANNRDLSPFAVAVARRIETTGQYLRLGFLHILPQGTDHILFVLGLFFLGLHWRPLLSQTTAFTIAHTTTLGLSAYGIFSLPSRIVEPLIAVSIAFVALENIFRPRLTASRIAIVFAFGLLHGLGFASSLQEVPMPRDQFFTALLAFNFGVDFGQLAIIAIAFLLVGWFRNRPWYRARVVIPACSLIALIGLFWAVQRVIG